MEKKNERVHDCTQKLPKVIIIKRDFKKKMFYLNSFL